MLKDKRRVFCLVVFVALFLSSVCFAQDIKTITEFTRKDRILILAPHPDDEVIGTGGVIQRALEAGAKIKVVLYTNGDNNELAFIVYEKRLTFRKREFLHMGEVRRKETLAAMNSLGIGQDNIVFLGYPDFGTMEILTKYWGKTKPFRSMLARVTKVAYPEAMSVNAPYVGESILKDIKKIIIDFEPTKIFVSYPADTNRDHRSLYLFLQVALWDLEGQIKQPMIFPYLIHVVGWPKPRGYHPDLKLAPPQKLKDNEITWQKLDLTPEEITAKHNAISFYRSQIKAEPPYLFTFARSNELFSDYTTIKIKDERSEEINQQDLKIPPASEEEQRDHILRLTYALKDKNFFVKLTLKRKIDKNFGVSIFLLGYNKKIDFSQMPKIRLVIGIGGLHIKDRKQTLFIKDARLYYEGKTLVVKVPLSTLGNPDYILSCANTQIGDLPLDERAWRIIDLE